MGFFKSLADGFTGKAAQKDIRAADAKASGYLDKGYADSQGYYGQAASAYDPYVQAGGKSNDTYNALLGLNGTGAQNDANTMLTSNSLFQGQLGQESNALLRNLNARGQSGGGQAQLAGQRVFQQNAGSWLDRYRDAGSQGFQASNAQAGVRAAQGDAAYGYGATKANQAVGYGNALAESRGIGINNLMGAIGSGISGYNALYNGGGKR